MSVSPAQLIRQVTSDTISVPSTHSNPSSAPTAAVSVESPSQSPPRGASSPSQLSTDMRVDSEHQIYYAYVDDRTGEVMFEIPPEALRAIGESLNVPLIGDAGIPIVDVKS